MTTSTAAKWSAHDEQGIRSFLPYGDAKRVRFILLDGDGNEVDRCGVANTSAAIKATFDELVRQNNGDSAFAYKLGETLAL